MEKRNGIDFNVPVSHIQRIVKIRMIKDTLLIGMGVVLAGIGLKGFLLPNHFLDGGAMGVSLLLAHFLPIELSVYIILVNLPFILMGSRTISKQFALKSALAILALAILVHFIELPIITSDKLLISVFGGFFLGSGIGLAIRGGSVIDGTEVLAVSVSRKSNLTVGEVIALFNIILFSVAAAVINIETAMYSMLTYLSASKTVDFIVQGIEEYIGVTIISEYSEQIKNQIIEELGRGVTVFKSDGGYGSSGRKHTAERQVLFCVVTRLEVTKLILEIKKVDPEAFIIQHTINDTKGGMIKKRPLH